MERVKLIAGHLKAAQDSEKQSFGQVGVKHADDVVIVSALRTPICRARKGGFKATPPEELLAAVLKGIKDQTGIDPAIVDDICVGNVLPPGGGATVARMASLYAGYPNTCSVMTVNRQCSSGLQAVASVAAAIKAGVISVGIGAGVESMSLHYGPQAMSSNISDLVMSHAEAADCLLPMGITSERVATKFGVGRKEQDQLALSSHQKAAKAQQSGWFKAEIVPVQVGDTVIDRDDGIRGDVSMAALSSLKPAFAEDGTTTAGNSSQVSDGAAAVLLMRRKQAQSLGLPILGKFVSFAVRGVPPSIMGIGPALAIPACLAAANVKLSSVDIFELNEAFASQAAYCVRELKIDPAKLNPKGGAIALGHPLGCTGARQIATLMPELKRQGKSLGVVSMCIGTGMGAAALIESEQ